MLHDVEFYCEDNFGTVKFHSTTQPRHQLLFRGLRSTARVGTEQKAEEIELFGSMDGERQKRRYKKSSKQ